MTLTGPMGMSDSTFDSERANSVEVEIAMVKRDCKPSSTKDNRLGAQQILDHEKTVTPKVDDCGGCSRAPSSGSQR